MKIDDQAADGKLARKGMRKMNDHFEHSNYATAWAFAVSYLASLIVYYEMATDQEGGFDYEKLASDLRRLAKAGHGRRLDTVTTKKKR